MASTHGPNRDEQSNGNQKSPDAKETPPASVSLPEIIPPEAVEAFRKIGIDTPEKAAAVIAITASVSRSPFPSPEMLKGYDDYKPGTGAEVMEWIKDQTRHRQCLERKRTNGSEKRLDNAQRNSLWVAILGILVGGAVAYWNTVVGVAIAVTAVGGPPAATILARILDKLDRVSGDRK